MVAAFKFEEKLTEYYNILFPLAVGTLKQLSRGQLQILTSSLWTQFEGLASAVAYLHKECNTAHRDLKGSNILLYEESETAAENAQAGRLRSKAGPRYIAKVADFGLAVNLDDVRSWASGTVESQSALQYGAPEMRQYQDPIIQSATAPAPASTRISEEYFPQPEELRAADVYTLGGVFTELLTFLVRGPGGGKDFRRAITRREGNLTSDQLDDGFNIKIEVLDWLTDLGIRNAKAHEIGSLIKRMFDAAFRRPSSSEVWDELLTVSTPKRQPLEMYLPP